MLKLSILILALNEEQNLSSLLPQLQGVLDEIGITHEIIVVDGHSKDNSVKIAASCGARVIIQSKPGYANGLIEGLRNTQGEKIITLDADFSHPPHFIRRLLEASKEAELVIASRYLPESKPQMSAPRLLLSRFTNLAFKRTLSLPLEDLTSGFRLYDRKIVTGLDDIVSKNFEVLIEILLVAYAQGWKIREIPFNYACRMSGKSHLNIIKFGQGYFKILVSFLQKRNSTHFADYDERAHDSWIPMQRYWHRRRFSIITRLAKDKRKIADLGCGSSRIIQSLPHNSIAFDRSLPTLRYLRKSRQILVAGKVDKLPFKNNTFDCVICSEVIEHNREDTILAEIKRVTQTGGTLILGTPDYARASWRIIEFLYGIFMRGGYKEEHIKHWNRRVLEKRLEELNFQITKVYYICASELIINAILRDDSDNIKA